MNKDINFDIEIPNSNKYPQNYFPNVFSKFIIKNVSLPNRIVFPPFYLNYANSDGSISEKLINFYSSIAHGGCGLVITGVAIVSKDSIMNDCKGIMRIDSENHIFGLNRLFEEIKKYNSKAGIQLSHNGRQGISPALGYDSLIAPSALPCPFFSKNNPNYRLREMDKYDIARVRNDFVSSALRAAKAGADYIEFHAGHGCLIAQFLSQRSNKRLDKYGGSVENRTRFLKEILEQFKEKNNSNCIVGVRISGNEFIKDGLEPNDYKDIIPIISNSGADLLHISAGIVNESIEFMYPDLLLGEMPNIDICNTIKKFSNIPVCTVGGIRDLSTAEIIIKNNYAELVAIGRSLLADPQFINKSFQGKFSRIYRCKNCNNCNLTKKILMYVAL